MEVLVQLSIQLALLAVANLTIGAALAAGAILAAHALKAKVAEVLAAVKA